jgi:arginine decarboxylase
VLDPSRLNLYIGATGIEGEAFKRLYLMDRYGVQVNKTSRNTALFMTNIGTTRSSVAYLIEVLSDLARELDEELGDLDPVRRRAREERLASLTEPTLPLPPFSGFHAAFRDGDAPSTPEGDIRSAFFMAYDERARESLPLAEARARLDAGEEVVSATFVTPYPPGFPLLVPGQLLNGETLAFLEALDTLEIHGYDPERGLRVFTHETLAAAASRRERQAQPAGALAGDP